MTSTWIQILDTQNLDSSEYQTVTCLVFRWSQLNNRCCWSPDSEDFVEFCPSLLSHSLKTGPLCPALYFGYGLNTYFLQPYTLKPFHYRTSPIFGFPLFYTFQTSANWGPDLKQLSKLWNLSWVEAWYIVKADYGCVNSNTWSLFDVVFNLE